jgi:hypothetical protein
MLCGERSIRFLPSLVLFVELKRIEAYTRTGRCRMLARNLGSTAIAALSLALGIGANSAIFSLADAFLLRPHSIRDPSAVVTIYHEHPDNPCGGVSANYRDLRNAEKSFEGMTAFELSTWGVATSSKEVAQMRMGAIVSDNFFEVLGVAPNLGRSFRPRLLALRPKASRGVDQYIRPALYVPVMMKRRLDASKDNPPEVRKSNEFTVKARLKEGTSWPQLRLTSTRFGAVSSGSRSVWPGSARRIRFPTRWFRSLCC